jgi:hypothetical protein
LKSVGALHSVKSDLKATVSTPSVTRSTAVLLGRPF